MMRDRRINRAIVVHIARIRGEILHLGVRQRAMLQCIDDTCHEHRYGPTLREMASAVALRSRSTVNDPVQHPIEPGGLRKGNETSRTLVLLEAGYRQLNKPAGESTPVKSEDSLEAMAADPAIRQEVSAIQAEFACTEGDGLPACETSAKRAARPG